MNVNSGRTERKFVVACGRGEEEGRLQRRQHPVT